MLSALRGSLPKVRLAPVGRTRPGADRREGIATTSVALRLLAGKRLQVQMGLGLRLQPLNGDHVAEVAPAPPMLALAHHRMELAFWH